MAKITYDMFSDEQKLAYTEMIKWIESPKREFLLTGYAGTGKTTIVRAILDYTNAKNLRVACTAPTNEAVRVISSTTGTRYDKTIFGLMGLQLVEEDDKEPVIKPIGDSHIEEYDLIIVDESSMIYDELYRMVMLEIKSHSRAKILWVGDEAQLPPVKDKTPSPVFKVTPTASLVNVQRAAAGNPIIGVCTLIRSDQTVENDLFARDTIINHEDSTGIEFIDDPHQFIRMACDEYSSQHFADDPMWCKVLCYTNKSVDFMNRKIREKIFPMSGTALPEYLAGDLLVADAPIIKQVGRVKKIILTVGERLRVISAKKHTDPEYLFDFWDIHAETFDSEEVVKHHLSVVASTGMNSYKYALTKLATQAKERMYTKHIPKSAAWKPYFAFKESYHKMKYYYAQTVHKSQGGTFRNVYVIERDINKLTWDDVERNKLKYVAFSRASHLLRILH